ncbi:MAG: polysaccharide deacetylase family protein [Actinomycetes bacterium]
MSDRGDQSATRLSVSSDSVHQRRRRVAAVGVLALAALAVWGIGSMLGGSSGQPTTTGFAARLTKIGGTGPGSLLDSRKRAEDQAVDRTLAQTPYIVKGGGESKKVALTFDDGPSEFTPKYLEILKREAVPATFFTVGGMYSTFAANATAAHSSGYSIANHTWSHPRMPGLSVGDQASQIDRVTDEIKGRGLPSPKLYRPPYGAFDTNSTALTAKRGMLLVLWDVDTLDWERPGADAIVYNALSGARNGSIILMHDGGGDRSQTLAALPRIIKGLKQKGFELVTVEQMLVEDPPRPGETPPAPSEA